MPGRGANHIITDWVINNGAESNAASRQPPQSWGPDWRQVFEKAAKQNMCVICSSQISRQRVGIFQQLGCPQQTTEQFAVLTVLWSRIEFFNVARLAGKFPASEVRRTEKIHSHAQFVERNMADYTNRTKLGSCPS